MSANHLVCIIKKTGAFSMKAAQHTVAHSTSEVMVIKKI